jgi:TPR repeat protein
MQKTGIIATLVFVFILAVGGFILKQQSYKICWNCTADEYFVRGTEYSCSEKDSYRQTGLEFITNAANDGHLEAELLLAELYSKDLPEAYLPSGSKERACLLQDVTLDQQAGLSYFQSVSDAIANGQKVDTATLLNLALLYHEGLMGADGSMDKAVWLYEKAAADGSFVAMRTLGKLAQTAGDDSKALHWLRQATENPTDFESPLVVADYYLYGKGTTVDLLQAQELYRLALSRTEKVNKEKRAAQRLTKKVATIRLDIVGRKLEALGGDKQRVAINYYLEGGVKRFVVFVADRPEQIGVVYNDDGNIHAAVNVDLDFAELLLDLKQDNFSSMTEGVQWLLNSFAGKTQENAEEVVFDFVLTDA